MYLLIKDLTEFHTLDRTYLSVSKPFNLKAYI